MNRMIAWSIAGGVMLAAAAALVVAAPEVTVVRFSSKAADR
jgi:hypothetical protein